MLILFSAPASSGAAPESEEPQWLPSLALAAGFNGAKLTGSVNSLDSSTGESLRPPASDSDIDLSPFVGVDLELLTPTLPIPGRPRVYLSGELLPSFGVKRDLAKEGNPVGLSGPELPPPRPGETLPPTGYTEAELSGAGSRASSELDTLIYGAGVGLAFPLKWGDRHLLLKTSVEWTRFKYDYEGLLIHGECRPRGNQSACVSYKPPNATVPVLGRTREIILSSETSRYYDAIGPGLELEVDTGRFGPLGHGLFLGARAYRVLGDRTVHLSDSQTYEGSSIPDKTVRADWDYKLSPWVFRAVLGLRVYWRGSGG